MLSFILLLSLICLNSSVSGWYSDQGFLRESRNLQPNGDYNFGYNQEHQDGTSFRQERRQGNAVTGSYGMKLPDGRTRVVRYIADELGYRAFVDSNEPGVSPVTRQSSNPVRPVSAVAPIWRPSRLSAVNRSPKPEVKGPVVAPSVDLLQQVRQQQLEAQKRSERLQQPQWVQEQQQRLQQQQEQQLQRVREWQQRMQNQLHNQLEQARTRYNQPLSENVGQGEWRPINYVAPLPPAHESQSTKTRSSPAARQQWERRWTSLDDNQINRNQLNVERERAQDDFGNRRLRFNMQFARTNANRKSKPIAVQPVQAPLAVVQPNQTEQQIVETTTPLAVSTTELPTTTQQPDQTNLTLARTSDEEENLNAQKVEITTLSDNLIETTTQIDINANTTISVTTALPTTELAQSSIITTTVASVSTDIPTTTVASLNETTTEAVPSTTTNATMSTTSESSPSGRLRQDISQTKSQQGKGSIVNGPRWMLYSQSPTTKRLHPSKQDGKTRLDSVEAEVERLDDSSLRSRVPRK